MTNKKAIECIKEWRAVAKEYDIQLDEYNEVLDMAIKALSCSEKTNRSDLIRRQDALYACFDGWNKDYKEIARDIRLLPSIEPKQNWIPISKKTPEESGFYNVSVINMYDRAYTKCAYYDKDHDYWHANQKIIAWMPLLKPYEG